MVDRLSRRLGMWRSYLPGWIAWITLMGSSFVSAQDRPSSVSPPLDTTTAAGAPATDVVSILGVEKVPIYVLRQAEDLPSFLKRLNLPDFLLVPNASERTEDQGQGLVPPMAPSSTRDSSQVDAGVTSIDLEAVVAAERELAHARIRMTIVARGTGPFWIPIGLDGLYPRKARDLNAGTELGWRAASNGGWELRIVREGESNVEIEVDIAIQPIEERRSLQVKIPVSPSTHVRVDLPYAVAEATGADSVPVVIADRPASDAEGSIGHARLEANLPARPILELRWSPKIGPQDRPRPLATAQGDLELNITARSLSARSTWVLLVRRGEVRSLILRLDAADELLGVEVEGRPSVAAPMETESDQDAGQAVYEITLPRAVGRGESLPLSITTRRSLDELVDPTINRPGLIFRGHAFVGLAEQSGYLTLSATEGLRVRVEPGSSLRRIDPKQLSDAVLRSRPSLSRAFQFTDQPFELSLWTEPSVPRLQVTATSSVVLEPVAIWVNTWLDFRVLEGRPLQVRVVVPAGLEPLQIGPPGLVSDYVIESSESEGDDPGNGLSSQGRVVVVTLGERARDSNSFRLELSGRSIRANSGLDPVENGTAAQMIPLPVFLPDRELFLGGRVAVWSPASWSISVDEMARARGIAVEDSTASGIAEWPLPSAGAPIVDRRPTQWIEYGLPMSTLPLQLEVRPTRIHQETQMSVRVDRETVDMIQDLNILVRDGEINELELLVPSELEGLWSVDRRAELAAEEFLEKTPEGVFRYRMRLVRPLANANLNLTFRTRRSLKDTLEADDVSSPERAPGQFVLPWILADLNGTIAPARVELASEAGVSLTPEGRGWMSQSADGSPTSSGSEAAAPRPEWIWLGEFDQQVRSPSWPEVRVAIQPLAALSPFVASRLWIRSTQTADGSTENLAWFRVEFHQGAFYFSLPEGSTLNRAFVAGSPVSEVEQWGDSSAQFRLRLPGASNRLTVVGVAYETPAKIATQPGPWEAPQLLEGGCIQEVLWEIRVPWSRALVGRPDGWTDENQWYWGGYVLKRRPWKSQEDLVRWILGPTARPGTLAPSPEPDRIGEHGYLFGSTGAAIPLRASIVPRAVLLGLCSGTLLACGLAWMAWRPLPRGSGPVALGLILLTTVFVDVSTILLTIQSSLLGVILLLLAAGTRRTVERRGHGPRRMSERSGLGSAQSGGVATPIPSRSERGSNATPVGSDDSTAIRPRRVQSSEPRPDSSQNPSLESHGSSTTGRSRDEEASGRRGLDSTRSHKPLPRLTHPGVLEISMPRPGPVSEEGPPESDHGESTRQD